MADKHDQKALRTYHDAAIEIAKEAGQIIKEAFYKEKNIETKLCGTDLVTETDKNVEELIITRIKEKFPKHSFIGEESVAAGQRCELTDNPTWIVDPLDGTTNFVHRFPFVAVSMGLTINKKLVVGVVYSCILDEMFSAIIGEGAYCNGKKLCVSGQTELNKALILTEVGSKRDEEILNTVMSNYRKLVAKPHPAHSIRSLGSAAINMCIVASGGADSYYEFGIHCWDISAGCLIVEEAGGIAIDPSGGPVDLMAQCVICASSEALAQSIASQIEIVNTGRD